MDYECLHNCGEQLAAEQFERKIFIGISLGQKIKQKQRIGKTGAMSAGKEAKWQTE